MTRSLFAFAFNLAFLTTFAQAGSNDPTFNPGAGANSYITCITLQPDGKILIGGNFTSYDNTGRSRIARLNVDGSLDTGFDPGTGTNGAVYAMALQPDGKILLGGDFTLFDGEVCENMVRLNPTGDMDTTFHPVPNNPIYSIIIQPDGKIITGSHIDMPDLSHGLSVKRMHPDGSADVYFQCPVNDLDVNALNLQPDGKIIVAGLLLTHGTGQYLIPVFRLNSDGSRDTTFILKSLHYQTTGHATALQSDGKILLAGHFALNYQGRSLLRLNTNGQRDGMFQVGPANGKQIYTVSIQTDGKIIIGGNFEYVNFVPLNGLARLNVDGTLDTTFDPGSGADNTIFATAIQPDGKVIVGGRFLSYDGTPRTRLARVIGCNDGEPCAGPALAQTAAHEQLGLRQHSDVAFEVWPNPNDGGHLHLKVDGLSEDLLKIEVELYDATGRRALDTTLPVTDGQVNVELELDHAAQGFYVMKVHEGDRVYSECVVVHP